MEKSVIKKYPPPNFARTLLIFAVGGFSLHIAVAMVYMICNLIWVDFIHYNPNRSQSNALLMMALSPIYGLFIALLNSELSLIIGALGAMISQWIWRRVTLYSLVAMFPLCCYAMYIQMNAFPGFYSDPPLPLPFDVVIWRILMISMFQIPILIGCWWWSNHNKKV
jgi:hypothetical protein